MALIDSIQKNVRRDLGWMEGATITAVSVIEDELRDIWLVLTIQPADGGDSRVVTVARDQEGNGPGWLEVLALERGI